MHGCQTAPIPLLCPFLQLDLDSLHRSLLDVHISTCITQKGTWGFHPCQNCRAKYRGTGFGLLLRTAALMLWLPSVHSPQPSAPSAVGSRQRSASFVFPLFRPLWRLSSSYSLGPPILLSPSTLCLKRLRLTQVGAVLHCASSIVSLWSSMALPLPFLLCVLQCVS